MITMFMGKENPVQTIRLNLYGLKAPLQFNTGKPGINQKRGAIGPYKGGITLTATAQYTKLHRPAKPRYLPV